MPIIIAAIVGYGTFGTYFLVDTQAKAVVSYFQKEDFPSIEQLRAESSVAVQDLLTEKPDSAR